MTTVIVAGCCVAEAGPMFGLLFCVREALQTEFQTCAGLCVWVDGLMGYALQHIATAIAIVHRISEASSSEDASVYIYRHNMNAWL